MSKYEEMIKDLGIFEGEEDITVTTISSKLKSKAVLVDLKLCGGNKYISLPKMTEEITNESKEFLNEHFSGGKMTILNKNTIKQLTRIKNETRNALYKASVIKNGNLIPIASFADFKVIYDEKKEEYNALKDQILDSYDAIERNFYLKVARYLSETYDDVDKIRELQKRAANEIPNKEQFARDFEFSMSLMVLPSATDIYFAEGDVQEEVERSIKENSIEIIENSISKSLETIFLNIAPFVNDKALNEKLKRKAAVVIEKVLKDNYLESKTVEDLGRRSLKVANSSNISFSENSEAEGIIAAIYKYFKERNNTSYLRLPNYIDEEYLENLALVY